VSVTILAHRSLHYAHVNLNNTAIIIIHYDENRKKYQSHRVDDVIETVS